MYFLIVGIDAEGSSVRRQELRLQHVAYWQSLGARVKVGGPVRTGPGAYAPTKTSVVLIEADDLTAAQMIADADPFVGQVFAAVVVTPVRLTLGVWPES